MTPPDDPAGSVDTRATVPAWPDLVEMGLACPAGFKGGVVKPQHLIPFRMAAIEFLMRECGSVEMGDYFEMRGGDVDSWPRVLKVKADLFVQNRTGYNPKLVEIRTEAGTFDEALRRAAHAALSALANGAALAAAGGDKGESSDA